MSYIEDYLFYASENEALPKLHQWACLMTLSAALSRKVWYPHGDWQISPNLYCFLVGPPASGKSVAMELAEKVVHDFTENEICPDQITREKFTEHMAKKCVRTFLYDSKEFVYTPITVFSDELVIFLGAEPIKMIDLLTALYGNKPTFKVATKNKGDDYLTAPCVSLLGCITPATLDSMMTQKLITGGFTRRMILVYAAFRAQAKPRPKMTPAHYAAKARCVEYAKEVAKLVGPFELSEEAGAFFDKWYVEVKDKQMRSANSDVMQRYFSAKDITLLKVAMLMSAAESLDKKIQLKHLKTALQWLDELEPDIMTVLGGGGRNDLAAITMAVQRYLIDEGVEVSDKKLRLMFHSRANEGEFREVLNHLTTVNLIHKRVGGTAQSPQIFYRADKESAIV